METKIIKKIQSAVLVARQNGGRRVRYPDFVKSSVAELIRSGHRPQELAILTGIGLSTVFKWSQDPEVGPFRKVAAGPGDSPSLEMADRYRITLPGGVCIECSSDSSLKRVLEYLK